MRRIVVPITLLIATATFAGSPAGAVPCSVALDDGSAATPHIRDPHNDYNGVVFGNQTALVPYGDVWREGTDVDIAWLARDVEGTMTAHIRVVQLAPAQPNTVFYFLWDYAGSEPQKTTRFVAAKLKGYGEEYTYGWLGPQQDGGIRQFMTEGTTTGSVDADTSTISITVPKAGQTAAGTSNDDWGAPEAGSILRNLQAEARVLIGSPEPLPPNPAGVRSGLVGVADDSNNTIIDICTAPV